MELIRKSDALHAVLHNTGDAAVAAVQMIPSAWIKCSERLPEESGRYLVCDLPYKIMSVVAYSARWKRFNCYDTFDEEYVNEQGVYEVTHWMPLHDAPEVDG